MSSVPCGMGKRGDGIDTSTFYHSEYDTMGRRSRYEIAAGSFPWRLRGECRTASRPLAHIGNPPASEILTLGIGRELMVNYGAMKVVYTSSERFMNEMIAAIRN